MANKRTQIIKEIVSLIKTNLTGVSPYVTNVFDNVFDKQIFLEDVVDFPTVSVYSGGEVREYLPGDFKWAFLTVNIRIYVQDEEAKERLEELFDDLELLIDSNNNLKVSGNSLSVDIRLLSLTDDEGLLNPLGVGELVLEVRYEV